MATHTPRTETSQTNPASAGREPPLWLAALPYLVLLAGAYHVFSEGDVGSFVTFRYAENLLGGHGPVYNVGDPVEGFTSPLHLLLVTLLMAVGHGVGIYFKVKLLGIALAILGLWQMRRLAQLVELSPLEATLAQLLAAVSVNYACAAVNGEETSLFICTLLGATITYVKEREGRSGYWSAALLFLVLLTRPDGAMIFLFLLCLRLNDARTGRMTVGRAGVWAATYVGLVVAFVVARWSYYGMLVPNTYMAKAVPLGTALPSGFKYLLMVLSPSGGPRLWMVASGAVFWGLAGVGLWRNRGRRHAAVLALAVASSIVFALKFGGGRGSGWRYMEPAAPFLAILQAWGLSAVASARVAEQRRTSLFVGVSVAVLLLFAAKNRMVQGISWASAGFRTDDSAFLSTGSGHMGEEWTEAGDLVRAMVPPGSLVMSWDTGYIAYENPQDRFLDLRGLTDRDVAALPKSYKSSLGVMDSRWYVPGDPLYAIWTRRRPDYVVVYDQAEAKLPGYVPLATVGHASSQKTGPAVRIYARL